MQVEKMRRPDDLDDADEEEDVDEDGEDGGDSEEIDTVALVHPAKFVFIHHSETEIYEQRNGEQI